MNTNVYSPVALRNILDKACNYDDVIGFDDVIGYQSK